MKAVTILLAIGRFLTTVAMADDVDDVKVAGQRLYVAPNTGDANALIQTERPINMKLRKTRVVRVVSHGHDPRLVVSPCTDPASEIVDSIRWQRGILRTSRLKIHLQQVVKVNTVQSPLSPSTQ